MSEFKKITVIGLGAMGSVLAKLLVEKNYDVTVWNRTKSKAKELVEEGANEVGDIAAAISSSEVIIVSVATYENSREVLRNSAAEEALNGKLLIQLSTGTPRDASEEEEWAKAKGINYSTEQ